MNNNIYLALDFPTWEISKQFITSNGLQGVPVKVRMELYYREGIYVIEQLKKDGHPIFLDLKLHDIPTTVKRAMQNLASLEVDLVNVHAFGGAEVMYQAKKGLQAHSSSTHETKLLAVTILTSMDEVTMKEQLRIENSVEEQVVHLAKLAETNGADGVVCSVLEAESINQVCHQDFLTVTPGIRLETSDANDQKRVATPAIARAHGASSIVIGRSVTQAANPFEAYHQAIEEWNDGITK